MTLGKKKRLELPAADGLNKESSRDTDTRLFASSYLLKVK
jgi:hypothetical protein